MRDIKMSRAVIATSGGGDPMGWATKQSGWGDRDREANVAPPGLPRRAPLPPPAPPLLAMTRRPAAQSSYGHPCSVTAPPPHHGGSARRRGGAGRGLRW